MLLRKKRQPLTREQSLKSVPIKNRDVEETPTESGQVILYLPRSNVWWVKVLSKIFYIPKGRKVALDELGTTLWNWFDGKATVGQLIKKFAEEYRLTRREAELSVVAYMKTLTRRGLIGIAVFEAPRDKKKKKKQPRKNPSVRPQD